MKLREFFFCSFVFFLSTFAGKAQSAMLTEMQDKPTRFLELIIWKSRNIS